MRLVKQFGEVLDPQDTHFKGCFRTEMVLITEALCLWSKYRTENVHIKPNCKMRITIVTFLTSRLMSVSGVKFS